MKTIISTLTIAVFASFLFMGGCVKKLTSVDIEYTTDGSIVTDSLRSTGYQTVDTVVVKSDLDSTMQKNGTSLDKISEIKLKSAKVSFTMPDVTKNFDKIDMVELWLTAPSLPAVKLAFKDPVAKGTSICDLNVSNTTDLTAYLKSPVFAFEVRGSNNAKLGPMDLTVLAVWSVKAQLK
jgi:hypothetical protein